MNKLCHWARQTQTHPQITPPLGGSSLLVPALPSPSSVSHIFLHLSHTSSILTPFMTRLACRRKLGTCHTPTTSVPSHTLCSPRVAGLLAKKPRSWLMPAECAGPQCRHQSFLLATVPVAGTGLPRIQLLGFQRTAVKCPWLMSRVT